VLRRSHTRAAGDAAARGDGVAPRRGTPDGSALDAGAPPLAGPSDHHQPLDAAAPAGTGDAAGAEGRVALPRARARAASVGRALLGPSPSSGLVMVHGLHAAGGVLIGLSLADSLLFSVSFDAARPRIILYLVVTMAPLAVVAPAIGPVVDRLGGNYRLVLAATNLFRALMAFLLSASLKSLLFYPEAFVILVLSRAYSVCKSALVPRLVGEPAELVAVNARLARASTFFGFTAGAIGAGVNALGGSQWTVRTAAVVYLVGTVLSMRLPRTPPRQAVTTPTAYAELHAPALLLGATVLSVQRAAVGFFTFLVAVTFKRSGEPTWVFGAILAGSALGAFIGTLLAPRLRRAWSEELMVAVSLIAPAAMALLAALQYTRPTTIVAAGTLGMFANVGRVAFDAIVQRDAPDAEQGRAFARFETRFQLAWVLGALVPVVFRPAGELGMLMLGLGLAAGSTVYLAGARAARRITDELHAALDTIVLGDDDPATAGAALPQELLRSAERLLQAGALRQAVVAAHSAVDVVRDRWCSDAAAQAADLAGLDRHAAPLGEIDRIRRLAIRPGAALGDDDAARAVELADAIVTALDGPRAAPRRGDDEADEAEGPADPDDPSR
jgi:hypothetical protein